MIDFHTHILPDVDDGSRSIEESIALLEMERDQGVTRVIATPHFDPRGDTPDEFLSRRQNAYSALLAAFSEPMPEIILGAEISYFYGLGHIDSLADLRIQGTKLLLIEMPMAPWSEATVRELIELAAYRDFKPVLAHIERYLGFVPNKVLGRLLDCGVLWQINASYVNEKRTRRQALRMIKGGWAHFLGSDCHGIGFRAPKIGEAAEIIGAKLGNDFFAKSESIFEKYKL